MTTALAQIPYAVNPLPFSGKVITVTGASRGLGLALTKYLLIRGATVSMCATSTKNLASAVAEIERELPQAKGRYWTCQADIRELGQVRAWIEQTVAKFGKLDGCANVAGVVQQNVFPITDLDPEYFANIIHTNIVGTFHCLQEEMKVIKEGGSIVNVGSVAGQYASPGCAAYVSSKHALIGLTKVAAIEGAPRQVRVNIFNPGYFLSDMTTVPYNSPMGQFQLDKSMMPYLFKQGRLPEAWEMAAIIAFLLGDETAHVTKAAWNNDGGWSESS